VRGGFNTIDFVQLSARYTNYNGFGGARRLNVVGTVGNLFANQLNGSGIFYDVRGKTVATADDDKYFKPTYSASIDVQQPWFGSPRNTIATGVFTHRRSSPGIFVDNGYGATATFTRLLSPVWPASLNYRFEETTVDAGEVYFCVSFGVCDAATLQALRNTQRLSPLAITTSADRTDNTYEPRRGYRARFDAEHASSFTASDFRYNRITNEESLFLPIGERSVLAGHIRGGYVHAIQSTGRAVGSLTGDDLLHPRKRFYLGGSGSVRGFMENQLGPRVLTIGAEKLRGIDPATGDTICNAADIRTCDPQAAHVKDRDFEPRALGGNIIAEASVEFRFPVYGDFLGAVFVDGGYLSQSANDSLPKSRAAITPGFGVRYISPVGPIRVDLGINPVRYEDLQVITEEGTGTARRLVQLNTKRRYSTGNGFLSRLTLHMSIGEAY
jgi:outer membrane protein insertion porin family/translocation and assembly module TamA